MHKLYTLIFLTFSIVSKAQQLTEFEYKSTKTPSDLQIIDTLRDQLYFIATTNEHPAVFVTNGSKTSTKEIHQLSRAFEQDIEKSVLRLENDFYFVDNRTLWKIKESKVSKVTDEAISKIAIWNGKLIYQTINDFSPSSSIYLYHSENTQELIIDEVSEFFLLDDKLMVKRLEKYSHYLYELTADKQLVPHIQLEQFFNSSNIKPFKIGSNYILYDQMFGIVYMIDLNEPSQSSILKKSTDGLIRNIVFTSKDGGLFLIREFANHVSLSKIEDDFSLTLMEQIDGEFIRHSQNKSVYNSSSSDIYYLQNDELVTIKFVFNPISLQTNIFIKSYDLKTKLTKEVDPNLIKFNPQSRGNIDQIGQKVNYEIDGQILEIDLKTLTTKTFEKQTFSKFGSSTLSLANYSLKRNGNILSNDRDEQLLANDARFLNDINQAGELQTYQLNNKVYFLYTDWFSGHSEIWSYDLTGTAIRILKLNSLIDHQEGLENKLYFTTHSANKTYFYSMDSSESFTIDSLDGVYKKLWLLSDDVQVGPIVNRIPQIKNYSNKVINIQTNYKELLSYENNQLFKYELSGNLVHTISFNNILMAVISNNNAGTRSLLKLSNGKIDVMAEEFNQINVIGEELIILKRSSNKNFDAFKLSTDGKTTKLFETEKSFVDINGVWALVDDKIVNVQTGKTFKKLKKKIKDDQPYYTIYSPDYQKLFFLQNDRMVYFNGKRFAKKNMTNGFVSRAFITKDGLLVSKQSQNLGDEVISFFNFRDLKTNYLPVKFSSDMYELGNGNFLLKKMEDELHRSYFYDTKEHKLLDLPTLGNVSAKQVKSGNNSLLLLSEYRNYQPRLNTVFDVSGKEAILKYTFTGETTQASVSTSLAYRFSNIRDLAAITADSLWAFDNISLPNEKVSYKYFYGLEDQIFVFASTPSKGPQVWRLQRTGTNEPQQNTNQASVAVGNKSTVYPNPSNGNFKFIGDKFDNYELRNLSGQLLEAGKITDGQLRLKNNYTGNYILTVSNAQQTERFKVAIN